MKCIQLYLLTFIITRRIRVEAAGELYQEDLQFIADRLDPSECSQLLSDFPGARGGSKVSLTEHRPFANNKVAEHFRAQCLDSLIECNERRKKGGCSRIWLEGALHKLGRVDLLSGLKRRWKKNSRTKRKTSTKRQPKRPKNGRINQRRSHDESRRKVLMSHRSNTIKNHEDKGEDDLIGQRFVTFLVAATLLIITSLACIMIVSYRRACRCYKDYLNEYDFKEQETFGRSFSTNGTGRLINSQVQDVLQYEDEHRRLVEESEKTETMDRSRPKNLVAIAHSNCTVDLSNITEGTEAKGCRCSSIEENCRKKLSLCERIRRFFDSPKCHLCDIKGTGRKRNKKRNKAPTKKRRESVRKDLMKRKPGDDKDSGKKKTKQDRKKLKKFSSGKGKRTNRERKTQKVRSNCKYAEGQKLVGCTCEVCKLLDVTPDAKYSERTKLIRR